jgi:hypothetical protein
MSYGYRLSKCENSRLITLSFLLLLLSQTKRRYDDVAGLDTTAYTLYRSSSLNQSSPYYRIHHLTSNVYDRLQC